METVSINLSDLKFIFLLTGLSFIVAMFWTPLFTDFLFKNRLGKRIRQTGIDQKAAPIFYNLHKGKENTPTMGGLLIWGTATVITLLLNLSRGGTWLPLFVLVTTGVIGAVDDLMNIRGIGPHNGGMKFGGFIRNLILRAFLFPELGILKSVFCLFRCLWPCWYGRPFRPIKPMGLMAWPAELWR